MNCITINIIPEFERFMSPQTIYEMLWNKGNKDDDKSVEICNSTTGDNRRQVLYIFRTFFFGVKKEGRSNKQRIRNHVPLLPPHYYWFYQFNKDICRQLNSYICPSKMNFKNFLEDFAIGMR